MAGAGKEAPGCGTSSLSARIIMVVDHIRLSLQIGSIPGHDSDLATQCYVLAGCIDFAVAANVSLPPIHEFPTLLKQLSNRRSKHLPAVLFLLMLSIKTACGRGLIDDDQGELLSLACQLSSNFSTPGIIALGADSARRIISEIMRRFSPHLKLTNIIVSREVKAGYEILLDDFYYRQKQQLSISQGRPHLFVAQYDKIDTSACLVSPPEVFFLINGKGVPKRIPPAVATGPQNPTDVSLLLVQSTNVLQGIGFFNGNYVVAVVDLMSTSFNIDDATKELQYYVQPPSSSDASSDVDVVEGASRITLNCPISFTRIRTPVKGRLCRHHQCFDYGNYMQINFRNPSWRCPHCNQPVNSCDICIDQTMVTILKEVGEEVFDVLIFRDGSWRISTDEKFQREYNRPQKDQHMGSDSMVEEIEGDLPCSEKVVSDVVDLTLEESNQFDMLAATGSIQVGQGLVTGATQRAASTAQLAGLYNEILPASYSQPTPTNPNIISFGEATVTGGSGIINVSQVPSNLPAYFPPLQCQENCQATNVLQFPTCGWPSDVAEMLPPSQQIRFEPVVDESGDNRNMDAGQRHILENRYPVQTHPLQIQTSSQSRPANFHRPSGNLQYTTNLSNINDSLNTSSMFLLSQNHDNQAYHRLPFSCPSYQVLGNGRTVYAIGQQQRTNAECGSQQHQGLQHRRLSSPIIREYSMNQTAFQNNAPNLFSHLQAARLQHGASFSQPPSIVTPPLQMQATPQVGMRPVLHRASSIPSPSDNCGLNGNQFATELPSEQDWRPTGCMRGSLTGSAFSTAIDELLLQPSPSAAHARQTVAATLPFANSQFNTS